MIHHGRGEILALADRLVWANEPQASGQSLDAAVATDADVVMLADAYRSVLTASLEAEIINFLEASGIDLRAGLLADERDEITRADATEVLAASAIISLGRGHPDHMVMPNIPKMSRAKSDSGFDVVDVRLTMGARYDTPLLPTETLLIASVKHSVQATASDCLAKLVSSFRGEEMTPAYVMAQLRVVHSRLMDAGHGAGSASRVFQFVSEFQSNAAGIHLMAVGVVSDGCIDDAKARGRRAIARETHWAGLILLGVPQLADLHARCV